MSTLVNGKGGGIEDAGLFRAGLELGTAAVEDVEAFAPAGINPAEIPGMIAGYQVGQTTRTGSAVDVWRDISGHGRNATADGTKDTVVSTATGEYASGGSTYTPTPSIPVDFANHTIVCIYGAGRKNAYNCTDLDIFALTDTAASGGGALFSSGTVQFYNATRQAGSLRNPTGINSVALRFGAGQCSIRANGITDTVAANGAASTTTFVDIWGYAGAGSFTWKQEKVALYFYNRILSDDEIAGVEQWHNVKIPTTALHVMGDSFVAGTGATTPAQSYARILEAQTGLDIVCAGSPGYTFDIAGITTFTSLHTKAITSSVSAGLSPIMVMDLGKNNLAANVSSATLQAAYTTFCTSIKSAGAQLVCVSMPPRTAGFSAGADATIYETQRLEFNIWLRTQEGTLFDKLADVGADTNIGDVADVAGAYYSGDGIHLSDLGHAAWAAVIKAEIDTL